MKRCSAPCVGKLKKIMRRQNTINFLLEIQRKLFRSSKQNGFYSDKKDYERAAIYRDKVQSIRDTQKTKRFNRI